MTLCVTAENLSLETLGRSGLSQFVSTVLSNAKQKGGKVGKREHNPGRPVALPIDNLQQLIEVKKLVEQMRALEKAKAAMDVLALNLS